jgi:adenylate cyclase
VPTPMLPLRIYEKGALAFSTEIAAALEVGRQKAGERAPFHLEQASGPGPARLVIAAAANAGVSRRHALLRPVPGERVHVQNVSEGMPIVVADRAPIPPGTAAELGLPATLAFGATTLRIERTPADAGDFTTLGVETPAPGALRPTPPAAAAASGGDTASVESMVGWLEGMLGLLQSAATSRDFFERACRATVEVAGLTSASVLMRDAGGWRVAARHSEVERTAPWRPSHSLLARVVQDRRTVFQRPASAADTPVSLLGVESVVAAPILDRTGEVIGTVYGDRRSNATTERRGVVGQREAMLVEMIACGVAAGLARVEQEESALAARVLMQQFFTPELARQLQGHPELLEGRDTEVTILVADIRGFTRLSERLGPAATIDWVRDVLGALSARVLQYEGVIVDYAGDEILAMWGAPQDVPDHAERACRAALDMLSDLPGLTERWRGVLGETFEFGIGVNTGPALVGNIGSASKFKYGALGSTVNIASRVQGASKYLKTRLIVTDATRSRLGPDLAARRLCQVRVVNLARPVTLFELMGADPAQAAVAVPAYERALAAFEAGGFAEAAQILGELFAGGSADGPALVLMDRALGYLIQPPGSFDPVWTLPGK